MAVRWRGLGAHASVAPVKLLLVSDIHYVLKQYDWVASVAPAFDAVVIAGDHLDISASLDGSVQIVVILKYLRLLSEKTQLIVSSGNHDLDVRDAHGEKIASWMEKVRHLGVPTDNDSLMLGDTLVTVCPWWDGPNAMAGVERLLERDAPKRNGRWIWVYHAPPEGSRTCWNGARFYGDAELARWIESYSPDLVFAGHVHQAPFRGGAWCDRLGSTWIFNCGRQSGPTPTHIAIDTDAQEAAWFSLAGAEFVNLGDALFGAPRELTEAPAWLPPIILGRGPIPA